MSAVMLVLIAGNMLSPAQVEKQEAQAYQPPPHEVVEQWRKAGARYGWVGPYGFALTDPPAHKLPAFRFAEGPLPNNLPEVPVPFGVMLLAPAEADFGTLREQKKLVQLMLTLNPRETKVPEWVSKLPQLEELRVRGGNLGREFVYGLRDLGNLRSLECERCGGVPEIVPELAALGGLRILRLDYCKLTDQHVPDIVKCNTLEDLSLQGNDLTDAAAQAFTRLPSLRALDLGLNRQFGDAGAKALAICPKLTKLHLNWTAVGDPGFADLVALRDLQELIVFNTNLGDAGLQSIAQLRRLRRLEIGQNQLISDNGLPHLEQLPELEHLRIAFSSQLTNNCATTLGKLHRLRTLDFASTRLGDPVVAAVASRGQLEGLVVASVTDAGMKDIARLPNLRYLFLNFPAISDNGLRSIEALKGLEQISISMGNRCQVSEAGMDSLTKLPRLKSIQINFLKIGDAGVRRLRGASNLENLSLQICGLTDASVPDLAGFRKLRILQVNGNSFSPAGIEQLRTSLPECEVLNPSLPPPNKGKGLPSTR